MMSFRIWEHLVELVSSSRTTIVITTHYIEEARQANVVSNKQINSRSNSISYNITLVFHTGWDDEGWQAPR